MPPLQTLGVGMPTSSQLNVKGAHILPHMPHDPSAYRAADNINVFVNGFYCRATLMNDSAW